MSFSEKRTQKAREWCIEHIGYVPSADAWAELQGNHLDLLKLMLKVFDKNYFRESANEEYGETYEESMAKLITGEEE